MSEKRPKRRFKRNRIGPDIPAPPTPFPGVELPRELFCKTRRDERAVATHDFSLSPYQFAENRPAFKRREDAKSLYLPHPVHHFHHRRMYRLLEHKRGVDLEVGLWAEDSLPEPA